MQLPLKRFPDSSVSSLILVGWCEEGHPATRVRIDGGLGGLTPSSPVHSIVTPNPPTS